MLSVKSPWTATFDQFVDSIQESAIISSPFITRQPVERLARKLRSPQSVQLDLMTNLDKYSLTDGLVDSAALAWLCEQVPHTTVRHLGNLHAKAYIADNHTAIVTSANLTNGGLWGNHELGVAINEPTEVKNISDDLLEYAQFGVAVPADALADISDMARQARQRKETANNAIADYANVEYQNALDDIGKRLMELSASAQEFAVNPEASTTAKFAAAVKYILQRNGPLPTSEINPLVQRLLPDWCDDNVERVIRGISYGRKWKHQVRNAQVQLRRDGVIVRDGNLWRLV